MTEGNNFEDVLTKFDENFNKEHERNWMEYWTTYGEKFSIDLWTENLEATVMANASEQEEVMNSEGSEAAEIKPKEFSSQQSTENIEQTKDKNQKILQDRWESHHYYVWYELQNLHSSAAWNYQCEFRKSLQYKDDIEADQITEIKRNHPYDHCEYESLLEDFAQLKLLGLPTKFGRFYASKKKGKRNKFNNQNSIDNQLATNVINDQSTGMNGEQSPNSFEKQSAYNIVESPRLSVEVQATSNVIEEQSHIPQQSPVHIQQHSQHIISKQSLNNNKQRSCWVIGVKSPHIIDEQLPHVIAEQSPDNIKQQTKYIIAQQSLDNNNKLESSWVFEEQLPDIIVEQSPRITAEQSTSINEAQSPTIIAEHSNDLPINAQSSNSTEDTEIQSQTDSDDDFKLDPELYNYFNFLASDEENDQTLSKMARDQLHKIQSNGVVKKKKASRNRALRKVPHFLLEGNGSMIKYWHKRFSLFSRYDEGIQLDKESWFSVTPEQVALHIAERMRCDVVVDGFCGCGGNTIQFAMTCNKVIAIDIDPEKIRMAQHNARIYGVAHKIEFIVGDFLQICDNGNLKADAVFVSPPWGGPNYKKQTRFNIEQFLMPVGATELIEKMRKISRNSALFLPRNSDLKQIIKLAGEGKQCEVQHNYLDTRLVALTALYGEDIIKSKSCE